MSHPGPSFVGIQKTYGRRGPLQQYRLAASISFRCIRCGEVKTAKLVCTYRDDPNRRLCNGCYGRLLSIYDIKSGTTTEDHRADALAAVVLSLASDADARDAARRGLLRQDSESILAPLALRFLGTSFYVAEGLGDLDLDWSAAVIGLCKAFELELVSRLIDPLRAEIGPAQEADRDDPELKRIWGYLSPSDDQRPPEMGSVARFLATASQSEQRANSSALIQAFRRRTLRLPGHRWLTAGEASVEVTDLARRYRNPASHTTVLTKADFDACREFVVGDEGLLWRLLDAVLTSRGT